jgi:hypothetical protein
VNEEQKTKNQKEHGKMAVKKQIERLNCGKIELHVKAPSREEAWSELTNLGIFVENCFKTHFDNQMHCVGHMEGGLIQIEQLERDGWTW